jgi:hypothetical protein
MKLSFDFGVSKNRLVIVFQQRILEKNHNMAEILKIAAVSSLH